MAGNGARFHFTVSSPWIDPNAWLLFSVAGLRVSQVGVFIRVGMSLLLWERVLAELEMRLQRFEMTVESLGMRLQ